VAVSDTEIESELRRQLEARGTEKTICPSEVARALGSTEAEWRPLMQPVRDVAAKVADRGELEFSQRGERVDPRDHRGAIRLRLLQAPPGADRAGGGGPTADFRASENGSGTADRTRPQPR
jgi:hypothetical protein